jgi:glutaredoxin
MSRRHMHHVVLYSRPGCHLCDVARETILSQRERLGFEFTEVDIEADDELELEYGIRIPVIEVDGEEAFEVTVDAERLARMVS